MIAFPNSHVRELAREPKKYNYSLHTGSHRGPKYDIFLSRKAATSGRAADTSLMDNAMKRYVTVGLAVVAGAALFEVALVPGLIIGGAAVLAPRYLLKYLPKLRRRLKPLRNATVRRRAEPATTRADGLGAKTPAAVLPKFAIGRAITKTITFRIIVTTLDFTTNYLVIGELGTAAGLVNLQPGRRAAVLSRP
jgi:hypothetical protein